MASRMRMGAFFLLVFFSSGILTTREAAALSSAENKPSLQKESTETIEEVGEVSVVAPAERNGILSVAGKLHPAVVHLPIGWITLLLAMDAIAFISRRDDWRRVEATVLGLACLSFIPAAASGFLRASALSQDPDILGLMSLHRNLNIAAAALACAGLVIRLRMQNKSRPLSIWLYHALIWSCGGALMLAGHMGGRMVFGANYLPF
jgi:uncharacterized membrane protein